MRNKTYHLYWSIYFYTMYLAKTPSFIQKIFSDTVFKLKTKEKKIYLTFDDGPTPEITEWVLQQLAAYNAHATFFVLGKNVVQYPKIFQQIIDQEHSIGNHTFNHFNGWKTNNKDYYNDIEKVETIDSFKAATKKLFRPPYGKLSFSQFLKLKLQYRIILWDVLSGDFDLNITGKQCFENCKNNIENGSVIVFHDSVKAFPRLKICLPLVLKHYSEQGFTFEKINLTSH